MLLPLYFSTSRTSYHTESSKLYCEDNFEVLFWYSPFPCQWYPTTWSFLLQLHPFLFFVPTWGQSPPSSPRLVCPGLSQLPDRSLGTTPPSPPLVQQLVSCYFVVLVPPLTGGTTTRVSGGTITVQAVAVVIYNYILRWRRWSLGTSVTTSNHSHPKQPKQYRTSSSIFSTTRV